MAQNLSIVSPDFDEIRHESGSVTSNAIKLLWEVLNFEVGQRRKGVRQAKDTLQGKITVDTSTVGENNLDLLESLVWWYNTASSFNVTGLRNGVEGRVVLIHNVGAGTITFVHNSASSDAANRLLNNGAANTAVATNQSIVYMYINSRWRELSLA